MDILYKRQHNESFMIISTSEDISKYEQEMIGKNTIDSLLTMNKMSIDGVNQYYYGISKLESLKDFMECENVTKELLQKILLYINMGLEEIGKYLIDQNHIFLSPETIFIEKSRDSFKVFLCFNPAVNQSVQEQMRGVLEWLITINAKDTYEVYELSLKDDFTIMELVESLDTTVEHVNQDEMKSEIKVERIDLNDDEDEISGWEDLDSFEKSFREEEQKGFWTRVLEIFTGKKDDHEVLSRRSIVRKKEDFLVEPDIELGEPTVLIKPEDLKCTGKLVYDGDALEDNFMVSGEVFRLGTADNNHGILHSRAVSRHHAKISKVDEDYMLEDLNSTNGTYHNGHIVEFRHPVKLKAMDEIRFGDVSYVFM